MDLPGTPARASRVLEPDRWLVRARWGVLLAGGALSLRWLLGVVWLTAQTDLLRLDGVAHPFALGQRTLMATQLVSDAVLALALAAGVVLLTSRALPGVSTRRWPLRALALAELGFSAARALSFAVFGGLEANALGSVIHVAAAVALLSRIAALCDAGDEPVAAVWARTGAWTLVAIAVLVAVVGLIPNAQVGPQLAYAWSASLVGLVVITLFSTLRAARWM